MGWRKIIFICPSPDGLRDFSLCRAFYPLTDGGRASAVMPGLRASLTLSFAKTDCGEGGQELAIVVHFVKAHPSLEKGVF